ncbi:MAG: hypothetical protein KC731_07590 [Myxococcales bacterium]|nr:hypothetical protein [Myxococcales bacterium]
MRQILALVVACAQLVWAARLHAQPAVADPSPDPAAAEPPELEWQRIPFAPERPLPRGFQRGSGPKLSFVATGLVAFGFAYTLSVVAAATDVRLTEADEELERSSGINDPLFVPLLGPVLAIASEPRPPAEVVVLAVDGVLQLGGLGLTWAGLALRDHWVERRVQVRLGLAGASLRASF